MQLIVSHNVPGMLVLPINYHHILQSIIYKNLENSHGYNSFMHDGGYSYEKKIYKLFTFGPICGSYELENGNIIFRDRISFELRSPDSYMVRTVAENIRKNGICYGETKYSNVKVWLKDNDVNSESVKIRMVSPISIRATEIENGKSIYYTPYDKEFYELVQDNFKRKYAAYIGIKPAGDIELNMIKVTEKDKYVTRYKDFYVSGWKGEYELKGERKYIEFLYNAGLGSRNSQGFGMFDIIE